MSSVTKYCKICYDNKMPESVYTSHTVKNRAGIVECPTLMTIKCRLCDHLGHTVKYCNEQKLQPQILLQPQKLQPQIKKNLDNSKPKSHENFYDLLGESDEEEKEEKEKEKEKPEKLQFQKRWIDYDSDSDEEEKKPNVQIPVDYITMPILRRKSSPLSYDSLDESYDLSKLNKFNVDIFPSKNPVLKRATTPKYYNSSGEEPIYSSDEEQF